jgi:multisubunit Na+/H+ antiporter MnhF subunit
MLSLILTYKNKASLIMFLVHVLTNKTALLKEIIATLLSSDLQFLLMLACLLSFGMEPLIIPHISTICSVAKVINNDTHKDRLLGTKPSYSSLCVLGVLVGLILDRTTRGNLIIAPNNVSF